jgi:hypothetical protein
MKNQKSEKRKSIPGGPSSSPAHSTLVVTPFPASVMLRRVILIKKKKKNGKTYRLVPSHANHYLT